MGVTLNTQNTINWATTIIKNQPLNISNWEPGLGFLNIVLQTMLGAPFVWRFNRKNVSFGISNAGGTDYVVVIADLGRIESMWLVNAAGNVQPLEGAVELPKTATVDQPTQMAPVYDDNAGNITFRFNSIPDTQGGPYTVFIDYQAKAAQLTSYGNTFSPVPDEFAYVFNMLFLGLAGNLANDPRAQLWGTKGIAALLGAQKGLQAQEIAIFLGEWQRAMNTIASSQGLEKAGMAGLVR